ncbi:PPK2 family polyphosphate kinase [Ramlibacter sp. PS4R-6]|uniref:PPK2 family polyphosphate kinase n=1 Tax=Ramlibacter sp. PS4R-6 TaxID=3133438 RepID=UPI00309B4C74
MSRTSKDPWLPYRFAGEDAKVSLAAIDPAAKPFSGGSKKQDKERVDALALELDELQNLFYADRRYRLLVVLQGTDTSGKDGTLRAVFGRMSPLGVRTVAWRAPSESERAHDFLWRIHWQVPSAGEFVVFNRSHYEDVLVPVVHGDIDKAEAKRRFAQINDFERLLAEHRTVILKFMLHISKDEQRQRLQERIDDPAKRWKFQRADLDDRKHWDDFQRAYERAIRATATPWAPWIVVPADSKTHRNLMIATALRAALKSLDLRYPDDDPAVASIKVQ